MRPEIAETLWRNAEPYLFMDRETYLAQFDGWVISEYRIRGERAFLMFTRGPEFHFLSLHTGSPITRKMIAEFLAPIIAQHGFAFTRTPKDDARQNRFNLAFGFKRVGEDALDVHYRIEALPCRS